MDINAEPKWQEKVDKFWEKAGRAWRIGCIVGNVGLCAFATWIGYGLYETDPRFFTDPGAAVAAVQTRNANESDQTQEFTPTSTLTRTPEPSRIAETATPTATLDQLAASIAELQATDTARSEADYKRDFEKLPEIIQKSAVKLELDNPNTGGDCSGTIVDIRRHPTDETQDIVIIFTANHCLVDESFAPFSSVSISQPQFDSQKKIEVAVPNMGTDGYGDLGVIALAVPHDSFLFTPAGLENVQGGQELHPNDRLSALFFNSYVRKEGFPAEYAVITGERETHFTNSVAMIAVNGVDVYGAAAPGASGAGVAAENGKLTAVISTIGGNANDRNTTSIYVLPPNYEDVVGWAVEKLLKNQELMP